MRPKSGIPSPFVSGAGSGVQGVDQLIQFVRNGLHLGLGERTGNGPDHLFSQLSTLNQPAGLPEHWVKTRCLDSPEDRC